MNIIKGITDSPRQISTIPMGDGEFFRLYLEFRPQQYGWFFDIEYGDFLLQGCRLVCGDNILRQFRGQIPFGLCVVSTTDRDPYRLDDFSTERVLLVVQNESEVEEVELAVYSRED